MLSRNVYSTVCPWAFPSVVYDPHPALSLNDCVLTDIMVGWVLLFAVALNMKYAPNRVQGVLTDLNRPVGACAFCLESLRGDDAADAADVPIQKLPCYHCYHRYLLDHS